MLFIPLILILISPVAAREIPGSGKRVPGNNPEWTLIARDPAGSVIQVRADGVVDIGCAHGRCVDGPAAGVTGAFQSFFAFWISSGPDATAVLTDYVRKLSQLERQPRAQAAVLKAGDFDRFIEAALDPFKQALQTTCTANYNQGGVWIKVVKNSKPYVGTQLYYDWENGINIKNMGPYVSGEVTVFAKAPDGGKNPESKSGYTDNPGSCTV